MFDLDKILDKKNVNGYSEEKQKRYKNGKEIDEDVIRVYVSNKEPISTLSAKDQVPEEINGIKTDVVELGEIKAQKNHRDKYRPSLGGVSVGHKNITAGTLGVVLWSSRLDKPVILTNNHVGAWSNKGEIGDTIYQPGPADHKRTEETKIGKLADFVEIAENKKNKQDSSVIEINNLNDVKPNHIDGYGVVTGFDLEPENNMKVRISSRTKPELSEGQVTDTSATISVNFNDFTAKFSDQILTTPISQPGDSGSVSITPRNKIVGLLFAGSPNVTVLNKIKYPKDAYGLKLFKEKNSAGKIKVQLKNKKGKENGDILFDVEDKNGEPISGAKCRISKGAENYSIFTDKNGKARLEDIKIKNWMYKVSKSGYQSESGFIDRGDFSNV